MNPVNACRGGYGYFSATWATVMLFSSLADRLDLLLGQVRDFDRKDFLLHASQSGRGNITISGRFSAQIIRVAALRDRKMLSIAVTNDRQYTIQLHETGPLVLGRMPDPSRPHLRIDDEYVSRKQLKLTETTEGEVQFENLGRNGVELSDGRRVLNGEHDIVPLPTWFRVGETTVQITMAESQASVRDSAEFRTIGRPVQVSKPRAIQPLKIGIDEAPSPEQLATWLETLLVVQRSAAGSREFYGETARAIVELVGLDRGLVLLKEEGRWVTIAGHAKSEDLGLSHSSTVLNLVAEQRRTFFGNPQGIGNASGSVATLEAVVASPIFDVRGEVVGIVYGSRDTSSENASFEIQPLEAQVIQLLAASVSSGLAHVNMVERLKQAEQLAAVGKAIGYVIHDLRGPLANVQQLVEIMRGDSQSRISPEEQLGYIDEAVATSLELLNECLEFCRGEVRVRPVRGTCGNLLGRHVELLMLELDEFEVAVSIEIPEDLEVILDPDRIARVLRNLAKNACEAVQGEPHAHVTIGARSEAGTTQFWVSDNGPGLPLEVQDKLFEPFVTCGKIGGTGFGLAISKQLVSAHNGEITVSTGRQGTCFTVTIPLAASDDSDSRIVMTLPQAAESESKSSTRPSRQLRILLAEDSLLNQRLMSGLLEEMGHRATIANNGREAVSRWEGRNFDLILMDVEMPEMDGISATRAIRAQEKGVKPPTPIVALTGHEAQDMTQACLSAGMNACLTKPIHQETLRRLMLELVESDPLTE